MTSAPLHTLGTRAPVLSWGRASMGDSGLAPLTSCSCWITHWRCHPLPYLAAGSQRTGAGTDVVAGLYVQPPPSTLEVAHSKPSRLTSSSLQQKLMRLRGLQQEAAAQLQTTVAAPLGTGCTSNSEAAPPAAPSLESATGGTSNEPQRQPASLPSQVPMPLAHSSGAMDGLHQLAAQPPCMFSSPHVVSGGSSRTASQHGPTRAPSAALSHFHKLRQLQQQGASLVAAAGAAP
ncbi:hypothetical protein QJQ45_023976 [Haematococcus lacustris]|nr:hypothetical protein QJQ45_023976 [Haematococcus lacustris]